MSEPPRPGSEPIPSGSAQEATESPHYVVGEEVARGGMGRIYMATDQRLNRPVALKQLLRQSPELLARFQREVQLTARLQHPSIVPIYEAGMDEEGMPYYAMKLVEGSSLREVLDGVETLPQRLALIPALISVCDAIAYAHDRGVIHRDIKPANVLLGEFGETLVIDWGLAKSLDEDDLGQREGAITSSGEGLTMVGALMGTPSFLAPEQARGKPADLRTDVYALGALLYTVLTGEPPFSGPDPVLVVARVAGQAPDPLPEAIPADLRAIVRGAMASKPADRPSARELSQELRRWQTGQLVQSHDYSSWELASRWVQANRRSLWVAGGAAALMLVGAAISVGNIVEARNESDQRREAAEQLVSVVVDDLRVQLESVGQLELMEAIAGSVQNYYVAIQATSPSDGGVNQALALATLGEVRRATGDLEASLAAHQAAFDTRREHGAPSAQLVDSHTHLTRVLTELGRFEDAVAHGESAVRGARELHNESLDAALRLARSHLAYGAALGAHGKSSQAMEHYAAVAPVLQDAGAQTEASMLRTEATFHRAGLLLARGDFDDARVLADQAAIEATLGLAASPSSILWRVRLAQIHKVQAHVEIDSGQGEASLERLDRAIELLDLLVAWDPTNVVWRARLAQAWGLRAFVEGKLDRPPHVQLATVREVARLAGEVLALAPDEDDARSNEALARANLANLERAIAPAGPAGEAIRRRATQSAREALDDMESVRRDKPDYVPTASLVSTMWLDHSVWLVEDGLPHEALKAIDAAMLAAEGMDTLAEDPAKWHRDRMRVHVPRARILHSLGDEAAAMEHLQKALHHYTQMGADGVVTYDLEGVIPEMKALAQALSVPVPPLEP